MTQTKMTQPQTLFTCPCADYQSQDRLSYRCEHLKAQPAPVVAQPVAQPLPAPAVDVVAVSKLLKDMLAYRDKMWPRRDNPDVAELLDAAEMEIADLRHQLDTAIGTNAPDRADERRQARAARRGNAIARSQARRRIGAGLVG